MNEVNTNASEKITYLLIRKLPHASFRKPNQEI